MSQCALVVAVSSALGSTWYVEKDGSGDFSIIQDAIDAAAAGDTILIGPGTFTDSRPIPNWDGYRSSMAVYTNELVVRGAGEGQTIIGDGVVDWYYQPVFTPSPPSAISALMISDLTITGGWDGIHYESDGLTVERCEFYGMKFGITCLSSDNGRVSDCSFLGLISGIFFPHGGSDWVIEKCYFDATGATIHGYGLSIQSCTNVDVIDCILENVGVGVQYTGGSVGQIIDTVVSGKPGLINGAGFLASSGSHIHMEGCHIDFTMTSAQAVAVSGHSSISGSGNVILGGGETTLNFSNPGPDMDFHNNVIFKAEHLCVKGQANNPNKGEAYAHLDLTNNYWGTADSDSIAAWIDDAHDYDGDHLFWLVVDYEPFQAGAVPVQKRSLGSFKGMFR